MSTYHNRELSAAPAPPRQCAAPLAHHGQSAEQIFDLLAQERAARSAAEAVARENTRLYEQARRAAQMREEVLGVVSHDLRAPLAVISMCARTVEKQAQGQMHVDATQVRQAMRTIRESTGLMERMIQDLLDVATIEAGRLSLERRPEDVVVILMTAAELFDGLAAERSIRLVADVPDHLPLVSADAERILQVLANLLSNAIKFTEAGGEVAVRARATPSEVVLSVMDTGPGVAPEHVPHIFDHFWRAHRAERARGAGLGLAIAKGIVEAHGGRIWVDSVPGQGSVFHFTLPIVHVTATPAARAYPPAHGDSVALPA